MQTKKITLVTLVLGTIGLGASSVWSMQERTTGAIAPITMIVSVEAKHGKDVPVIYKEDVRVLHDHDRLRVVDWVPCAGDQTGLDLFLLIDDSTGTNLGSQLDDLRKFINGQPVTTSVAVGYIRNGVVDVRQNLTQDHSLAAKALRMPLGSAGAVDSPYTAITDLIERWPKTANSREIFLVSSGIDALQPGPNDSYLDQAIDHANRAGIPVNSIYASRVGHLGHTFWRFSWGQNNLSRLADETGGEAYFQGLEMPISYGPYLDQFADRLKHQYRLTFLATPGDKAGFQKIHLTTEVENAELVAADGVWVPAAKE